jgi:hypothetical protein
VCASQQRSPLFEPEQRRLILEQRLFDEEQTLSLKRLSLLSLRSTLCQKGQRHFESRQRRSSFEQPLFDLQLSLSLKRSTLF